MSLLPTSVRRTAGPIAFLVGALVLWNHIVQDPDMLDGMPGLVGPAGWPRFMLIGIGICALIWLLIELRASMLHLKEDPISHGGVLEEAAAAAPATAAPDEHAYNKRRAAVGLALVILYGLAIPQIGFLLSTLAYIALWCLFGGVRRPSIVVPVTLLGTLAILYMFVMLAQMPLDRGHGVFDELTVYMYRALGIY